MKDLQNPIIDKISQLLELARNRVAVTVNQTMVLTYFEIGRTIVEEEQNGQNRAEYGKILLNDLSFHLTQKFGRGFSETNLKQMRQFYLSYAIRQTLSDEFKTNPSRKTQTPSAELQNRDNQLNENSSIGLTNLNTSPKNAINFTLSWSHYLKLMRIKDINERKFYEIEAHKNNWSLRVYQRIK